MSKPSYGHSFTLTEADEKRLNSLKGRGYRVSKIIKLGLEKAEQEVSNESSASKK